MQITLPCLCPSRLSAILARLPEKSEVGVDHLLAIYRSGGRLTATLGGFLGNLGIIFSLVALWGICLDTQICQAEPLRKTAIVVSVSVCAVLLMSFPIAVREGVIFDLRAVPIVLAGFLGGASLAVVVAVIAGAYRLALGGAGAWPAVAGILLTAAVGVVGSMLLKGRRPRTGSFLALGGAAALTNLTGPILLPSYMRWEVLEQIALPAVGAVFISTVFTGKAISNDLQRREATANLLSMERHLGTVT